MPRKKYSKLNLDTEGNATSIPEDPSVREPLVFSWDLEWDGKVLKTHGSGWHGGGFYVHQIDQGWYAVYRNGAMSADGPVAATPKEALGRLQNVLRFWWTIYPTHDRIYP